MQAARKDRRIRRRKSRRRCRCGAPVLFRADGPKAKHRLHTDAEHDLCADCFARAAAYGRHRAAEIGVAT